MRKLIGVTALVLTMGASSYGCGNPNPQTQPPDPSPAIHAVMDRQVEAWNHGDLEGFLDAYWNSPELIFASRGRFSRGWDELLQRYREGYPRDRMGKLLFDDIEIRPLGAEMAWTVGSWSLEHEGGSAHGVFTLLWRKTDAGWRIIHDHSSGVPEDPATD